MSSSKYISNVKIIDHDIEGVFNYLSDFKNLSRYFNQEILGAVTEKFPQVSIRDFEADHDSCRFNISGFGAAEIRIVERTPFSTIKIQGEGGLPLELKFWIQLMPVETSQTKMRLTLTAEMSMLIKMMVDSKLEKGIDQLAEVLAHLPYQ